MSGLPVLGSSGPWSGGEHSVNVACVLAPNPGPMTLDGTNTWVLRGAVASAIVVDPGPDDLAHLRAVTEAAGTVREILLTHAHADHAEGAQRLHEMTGARVRALDPRETLGGEGLRAGDVVTCADMEVHVVATPGHTADSLSFHVPSEAAILTGDTVLGRGTAVVAWPDGQLGPYLASLSALRERAAVSEAAFLLPGHGPTLPEPVRVLDDYLAHRRERLRQVQDAWNSGARTPEDIVGIVYADAPESVRWAALLSTRAQVEYLREMGS